MLADQVAHVTHLNARDTTLAFASRAPQADIARVKRGWVGNAVVYDHRHVRRGFRRHEWHGTNVFLRHGDRVYRTYFIQDRGDEQWRHLDYLDITPLGRRELWEDSPRAIRKPSRTSGGNEQSNYAAEASVNPGVERRCRGRPPALRGTVIGDVCSRTSPGPPGGAVAVGVKRLGCNDHRAARVEHRRSIVRGAVRLSMTAPQ